MPSWPSELPQYVLVDGYQEAPPELLAETEMDAGPPASRRRFTVGETTIACRLAITTAEKAAFEAFFRDTLKGGAIPFDWVHPVSRAPVSMQLRRPRYTPEPGGATFILALELRVQPA